jgi:hypothetical protein
VGLDSRIVLKSKEDRNIMMGGWQLRLADMMKSMTNSTSTLSHENNELSALFESCHEVQSICQSMKRRMVRGMGDGRPIGEILTKHDVDDLAQRTRDIKDQILVLCKTHLFPFNPHLEEYIRKHTADCAQYVASESAVLRVERRQGGDECRVYIIDQCQANLEELHEATKQLDGLGELHFQRNRVVLMCEAYMVHTLNNATLSANIADTMLEELRLLRIFAETDSTPCSEYS